MLKEKCPDPTMLALLADRALPTSEIDTLAAHVAECSACGEALSAIAKERSKGEPPPTLDHSEGAWTNLPLPSRHAGFQTGDKLGGYILGERLGAGGMGVVYRARQPVLARDVAIKLLPADRQLPSEARRRFREEALAAGQLKHPNLVQVYEFGEEQDCDFLVMELADGGSLRDRLQKAPPAPEEAAQIIVTLARAIQAAHDAGIVHRDLKPSNVLATSDGTLKIADFGLARRINRAEDLTATGAALGTPAYMAPEQAEGSREKISPATDIYSLGVMLYEMLTGSVPFHGEDVWEILRQTKEDEPESPSRRSGSRSVPIDLEKICLKCLAKLPGDRYALASDLADDLDRFLRGEPVAARPLSFVARAWRWTLAHWWQVAGVALLLLSSGLYYLGYHHEFIEYYESQIDYLGEPVGYLPLRSSDVAQRLWSLRFTRQGWLGKVHRVDCVNSRGALTTDSPTVEFLPDIFEQTDQKQRPATFTYARLPEGGFETAAYDIRGELCWRCSFRPSPKDPGWFVGIYNRDGGFTLRKNGPTAVKIHHDELGKIDRIRYFDDDDHPIADRRGAFGRAFEWKALGVLSAEWLLDANDQEFVGSEGWSRIEYDYTPTGRPELIRRLALGQPVVTPHWGARTHVARDAAGNIVGLKHTDAADQPVSVRMEVGAAQYSILRRRVEAGLIHEDTLLAADGTTPIESIAFEEFFEDTGRFRVGLQKEFDAKGKCTAQRRVTFDEIGNRIRLDFLDAEGKPSRGDLNQLYDEFQYEGFKLIGWQVVGLDEKRFGFARQQTTYHQGYHEIVMFDSAGKPVRHPLGYMSHQLHLDAQGTKVREVDLGFSPEMGYASRETEFADDGKRPGRTRYFAADGSEVPMELRVMTVGENSPGGIAGMEIGDVIVRFGDRPIHSYRQFSSIQDELQKQVEPIPLIVRRGSRTVGLKVPPGRLGATVRDMPAPKSN